MICKMFAYASIVFGGTISGGLVASLLGPVQIRFTTEDIGVIGACLGAGIAIVGCRFAMEHHDAMARNRDLIRTLETRVARVAQTCGPIVR